MGYTWGNKVEVRVKRGIHSGERGTHVGERGKHSGEKGIHVDEKGTNCWVCCVEWK